MEQVNWLYIDLNSFFASCEQQDNPQLRGKPVAIVPMMAETTSCLAASYEAKRFGVKTGTRVNEARLMCPGIQFVKARHDAYIRYHHKVLEVVESCIPVEAVMSVDEFACKLTGSQKNPEKAALIAEKIKQALKKEVGEYVTCSIGISTSKFLAKIATDMQKPNGLTFILKSDLPQKLYSLKLTDIPGVGRAMDKRLTASGIFTIKDLLSLSKEKMKKIWSGVWGERLYLWFQGEDFDLPATKNKSISHEHVLPPSKRSTDGAHEIAKKLLTKLAVRLRRGGFYTKNLNVYVRFMDASSSYWEAQARFNEVRDTMSLLHKLEALWKDYPKNKKPIKVAIGFSELVSQGVHQFSLFENPKQDEISNVMDKINKKFGKEAIHLGATHEQKEAAPTRIAFRRIPELDEI